MRRVLAALAVATGVASTAMAQEPGPSATVLVINRAGVPADVIAAAQAAATATYVAAGVRLTWVTWAAGAEGRRFDFTLMVVTRPQAAGIARASGLKGEEAETALGLAPVSASADHGRMAYVFPGRIEDYAGAQHLPYGALLGHVIAHELGHLLLGVNSHGERGIMQARPNPRAVLLERFTNAQAALIREYLTRQQGERN